MGYFKLFSVSAFVLAYTSSVSAYEVDPPLDIMITVWECEKPVENGSQKASTLSSKVNVICGQQKPHMIYTNALTVHAGDTKTSTNKKDVPYFVTKPSVVFEDGAYQIIPEKSKQVFTLYDELTVSTSHQIAGYILVSLSYKQQHHSLVDKLAYYDVSENYLNPVPVVTERSVVATGKVKVGEKEILSGEMWVEHVQSNDLLPQQFPERERLWIEVSVRGIK